MKWNPFAQKNKTDSDDQLDNAANAETHTSSETAGKGRPTPKRRDAENARLTPLAPKDRKAQRKAAQARRRERENTEYEAMRSGDCANA